MVPLSPTAQPRWPSAWRVTLLRGCPVPLAWASQDWPASAVTRIVPSSPTAQPCLPSSRKVTLVRYCVVPLDCACQERPASVVFRIVPPLPTAQQLWLLAQWMLFRPTPGSITVSRSRCGARAMGLSQSCGLRQSWLAGKSTCPCGVACMSVAIHRPTSTSQTMGSHRRPSARIHMSPVLRRCCCCCRTVCRQTMSSARQHGFRLYLVLFFYFNFFRHKYYFCYLSKSKSAIDL